jgi:hypothetical protein
VPGQEGPVGPPGPAFDLAVLRRLSWRPETPQRLATARNTLGGMSFDFDRDLDPAPLERRNAQVVTAWFSRPSATEPVRMVRGTAAIQGNRVIWTCDPNDMGIVLELSTQTGALLLLDLNCDFVLDTRGQPASACSSTLVGAHLPRPGGILRTWLQIQGNPS